MWKKKENKEKEKGEKMACLEGCDSIAEELVEMLPGLFEHCPRIFRLHSKTLLHRLECLQTHRMR